MSDEYRRVLHAWAANLLPDDLAGATITNVSVGYYPGWGGTDVTAGEDPEVYLDVHYLDGDGPAVHRLSYDNEGNAMKMSALLRDLFAIAEAPAGVEYREDR